MRMGRLRTWAGLSVLALLTSHPVRAQELLPPPQNGGLAVPPGPAGIQDAVMPDAFCAMRACNTAPMLASF